MMGYFLHFIVGSLIYIIARELFNSNVFAFVLLLGAAVFKEIFDFYFKDPTLIDSLLDIACSIVLPFMHMWEAKYDKSSNGWR